MRILLVDDERDFVSAMAERLALRGLDADWALSGEQALEMAGTCGYDLAVLDMKMPRLGGLEIKRRLTAKCPKMKFIFLSGHGSEEDFRAGAAEAESYLIKPVGIEDLVARIKKSIE
ncbi:MAG: response regulator [Desulfovibrionaceae bacterium]|nr:response regulator [Desulfovibrionaceae bacterium]